MACFADINVSQGSVAKYVTYLGGSFNYKFTMEFSIENFFQVGSHLTELYGHESVAPFLAHPVDVVSFAFCSDRERP